MTERRSLSGSGSARRLLACVGALFAAAVAARAHGAVVVTIDVPNGVPGQPLTLTVGLQRTAEDPIVTAADADILFDTSQIEITGTCFNTGAACRGDEDCGQDDQGNNVSYCKAACQNSSQVNPGDFVASLPNTIRPPDEPPIDRMRVAVFARVNPNATYDTGPLLTCTFQVTADGTRCEAIRLEAPPGKVQASDPNTDPIPGVTAAITAGTIGCPTPTVTETPTETIPTPTDTPVPPTATPTNTPRPTDTATVRPTDTPVPPPTSTATSSVPRVKGSDHDGCAIAPGGSAGLTGLLWIGVPALMVLLRRRVRV